MKLSASLLVVLLVFWTMTTVEEMRAAELADVNLKAFHDKQGPTRKRAPKAKRDLGNALIKGTLALGKVVSLYKNSGNTKKCIERPDPSYAIITKC